MTTSRKARLSAPPASPRWPRPCAMGPAGHGSGSRRKGSHELVVLARSSPALQKRGITHTPGEDKMVGWHHRLNGYEFGPALGDTKGQGSLASFSPQG